MIYTLATVNQYEVICGYSDFESMLLHAVGANSTCCGWYSNLRQFSFDRFMPATGGQPARPRYSSLLLLNSILTEELDSIDYIGRLQDVLAGSHYDIVFTSQQAPSVIAWPTDISTLHHWYVLNQAVSTVLTGTSTSQRLDICQAMLGQAEVSYQQLMSSTVTFETPSSSRNIRNRITALANFRRRLGI